MSLTFSMINKADKWHLHVLAFTGAFDIVGVISHLLRSSNQHLVSLSSRPHSRRLTVWLRSGNLAAGKTSARPWESKYSMIDRRQTCVIYSKSPRKYVTLCDCYAFLYNSVLKWQRYVRLCVFTKWCENSSVYNAILVFGPWISLKILTMR